MMATNRKLLLASLSLPLLTTLLGGCIYRKETVAERTAPAAPPAPPPEAPPPE